MPVVESRLEALFEVVVEALRKLSRVFYNDFLGIVDLPFWKSREPTKIGGICCTTINTGSIFF